MLHIFKHDDGTFDFASIRKGRYIYGSNQHYEKKSDVIKTIQGNINHDYGGIAWIYMQDDTMDKPKACILYRTGPRKLHDTHYIKPSKPYIPQQKKKKQSS